jgi:3-dehydroquinate synthase
VVERILVTQDEVPACEILIGRGLTTAAHAASLLPPYSRRRRVGVLTQPSVARLAEAVAEALEETYQVAVRVGPDRDQAKTLTEAEQIYTWLNGLGMTRHDTIIGLGGGAVTDIAGFVAGTYLRGVEVVLVPTTLLGAVDAAIGGKGAVNVGGKNLVGIFRHPSRVLIDLDLLEALPEHLVREGASEALKTGLIGDPILVNAYELDGLAAPLDLVVSRSVAVKARVVSDDFTESGIRAHLNYGHTVGHAVETLTGWSHGEAVAVGMVAAGAASEHVTGYPGAQRQRNIIEGLGLPAAAAGLSVDSVLEVMDLDKKRDETGLRMVLLEEVGRPIVRTVDRTTVMAALAAVGIA